MATLSRPGVEISQVLSAETPTVTTPTLVPCIVGPCFQIVAPIDSDGSLNSDAAVSTAASIKSAADLGDKLAVSSKYVKIRVNNGNAQTAQLPVSTSTVKTTTVLNSLRKQLEGVDIDIVDNRLVFTSQVKGTSSCIEVMVVAGDAYDELFIDQYEGVKTYGQSNYTNSTYTVPYTSLPSPKADVSEIVVTEDELTFYRYAAGTLQEIKNDSAISMNSTLCGTTDIGAQAGITALSLQPAFGVGRTGLYAVRPSSGTKSNTLAHMGTDAYVVVPLGIYLDTQSYNDPERTVALEAADKELVTFWPNATTYYMTVEAAGLSTYWATGNTSAIGGATTIGRNGNDYSVVLNAVASPGDPITMAFIGSALHFTLEPLDADQGNDETATTYADLEELIEQNAAIISGKLKISLHYTDGEECVQFVDGSTFTLSYGSDPVNFAGTPPTPCVVCGAVDIGMDTPDGLDLVGESLFIRVDGGAEQEVVFATGADTVVAQINDNTTGIVATAPELSIPFPDGATFFPLVLTTDTDNGHDSTIQLRGSSKAIRLLFSGTDGSGAITATGVSAYTAGVWPSNGDPGVQPTRRLHLAAVDYNPRAVSAFETAIIPGTLTISVDDVTLMATITSDAAGSDLAPVGHLNTKNLVLDSGDNTFTIQPVMIGVTTLAATAAAINTALNVDFGGLSVLYGSDHVVCSVVNGKLTFSNVANGSLEITAGSHAAWSSFLNAGATVTGIVATADTGATVTFDDSGASNSLRVTAITNGTGLPLSNCVNPPSTSSISGLTGYILGGDGTEVYPGTDFSFVEYATGNIKIAFTGGCAARYPLYTEALPTTMHISAASEASITFTRLWSCVTSEDAPAYTSTVFHGVTPLVEEGDKLLNSGAVLGVVAGVGNLSVGTALFTGAKLTLSEAAVDAGTELTKWYIRAEDLVYGSDDPGRVEPEGYGNDLAQEYVIKHALNRDSSGIAQVGQAPVYVGYKALRLDVTADATDPGLLMFNSTDDVETLIGPISTQNPLAFGLYMAFLNTTNINIAAIGVADVSADAPYGTLEAYNGALDFLELKEVYAMAPLTSDMEVIKKFSLHVTSMSEPTAKKERMCIVAPALPTEKPSTLVASATFKLTSLGSNKYEAYISDEAEAANINIPMLIDGLLDANGKVLTGAVEAPFSAENGVYLDRSGDAFKYIITKIESTSSVIIETTAGLFTAGEQGPGTGGNDDGYFKTGADAGASLSEWEADGEVCTLYVRQAAVVSTTTAGKLAICETLAEIAGGVTGLKNRRVVLVQPERVGTTLNGLEVVVDGFYLSAAIAGMIGQQNPSQPFTNLPMVGFTRPVGSSDKFSENQMATAAAGGVYWVIQDVAGGSLVSRHQLTTDITSLKTRELSILKSVDYVAKMLRGMVEGFVGRNNITKPLLSAVSIGITAALARVSGSVVASASLDSITSSGDEIMVEVSLTPFYPANKIKITIYV